MWGFDRFYLALASLVVYLCVGGGATQNNLTPGERKSRIPRLDASQKSPRAFQFAVVQKRLDVSEKLPVFITYKSETINPFPTVGRIGSS